MSITAYKYKSKCTCIACAEINHKKCSQMWAFINQNKNKSKETDIMSVTPLLKLNQ